MITNERRAFKRVRRKFAVNYELNDPKGSCKGSFISENISLGGVYFISFREFEIGQILDCRIKMPGVSEEGRWTARVVRCENLKDKMVNTFGVAVEFIKSFGNSEKNLKKTLG